MQEPMRFVLACLTNTFELQQESMEVCSSKSRRYDLPNLIALCMYVSQSGRSKCLDLNRKS